MTSLQEITNLFAALASQLGSPNGTSPIDDEDEKEVEKSSDAAISTLNRSLNHRDDDDDDSTVRFMETTLSLMCFKVPQVFDSAIEFSVKTIVAVLTSSINCKVVRFQEDEALQVGTSILRCDCAEVITACCNILSKLQKDGALSHSLQQAVVRVAVSASDSQFLLPSTPILVERSVHGRIVTASRLLDYLPQGLCLKDCKAPLRLLSWYLDPLILSNDISNILQEMMERPLLCLHKELHERMLWQSITVCLVLSPVLFIEARALLHRWFLETGMACVLELSAKLVAVILDVITRPMWWGLTIETGIKLPFSNAYFPFHHRSLRTLTGPISCAAFQSLLPLDVTKAARIDDKSMWAQAINFPVWFCFACITLFSDKSSHDNCMLGRTPTAVKTKDMKFLTCQTAAARYIAWILCPMNRTDQEMLVDCLVKISESWLVKPFYSGLQDKEMAFSWKKLKKPRFYENRDKCNLKDESDCQRMVFWIEEFQNLHRQYCAEILNASVPLEVQLSNNQLQQSTMFREIPLGILIGWSSTMEEDMSVLFLHFATTGRIFWPRKLKGAGMKPLAGYSEAPDSLLWNNECAEEEAVRGACLIFRLTEVVEYMAASLFETEESELSFICRFKERVVGYLVKCIKTLIQFQAQATCTVLSDLLSRLLQWKHGQEVFKIPEDLDHMIVELNRRISAA